MRAWSVQVDEVSVDPAPRLGDLLSGFAPGFEFGHGSAVDEGVLECGAAHHDDRAHGQAVAREHACGLGIDVGTVPSLVDDDDGLLVDCLDDVYGRADGLDVEQAGVRTG